MTSRLEWLSVDCRDPRRLAEFWCAVLGYVGYEDRDGKLVEIGPDPQLGGEERLAELRRGPAVPSVGFVQVPEPKNGKNRLHFEVAPIDGDQDAELARLIGLGARKVDIGQGAGRSWVVMADPEGNEFCLLRSLAPGHFSV